MSCTSLLTEVIIERTKTDQSASIADDFSNEDEPSHVTSDSDEMATEKVIKEVIEEATNEWSEELELMKSLGLPTHFTSRPTNRRQKKKTKSKPKPRSYSDCSLDDHEFGQLSDVMSHCSISEECCDSDEHQNEQRKSPQDQSSAETKTKSTSSDIRPQSSIAISSQHQSDSDSDEAPEERPTRIKREHESDYIDFTENVSKIKSQNEAIESTIQKPIKKRKSVYWHQRYRLFSRFDEGIKLDDESWYSVTPERIAQHIASRFTSDNIFVIVDAFCGAGGNTIQFASISPQIKVIAVDIDEQKIGFAKHNAKIYGVDHRIEFIVSDYLVLAKTGYLKADAVFLSPPWGGPTYLKKSKYTLDMMSPKGADVFGVTKTYITDNIGFLLPRNVDINQLEQLAGEGNSVEIEQNRIYKKVKTVTAYFGNLIKSNDAK